MAAAALVARSLIVGRSSVEPWPLSPPWARPPKRAPGGYRRRAGRRSATSSSSSRRTAPTTACSASSRAATGRAPDAPPTAGSCRCRRLQDVQVDLQHNHHAAVTDIAGGAMNGFSVMPDKNGKKTMLAYSTAFPGQVPDYWGWAKRYELPRPTFSSATRPASPTTSTPSRRTRPARSTAPTSASENWACDGPVNLTVPVIRHGRARPRAPPWCFAIDSIGAQLDRRGIPWSEYGPPENGHGYCWVAYDAVKGIRESSSYARHVLPLGWLPSDLRPESTWERSRGSCRPTTAATTPAVGRCARASNGLPT